MEALLANVRRSVELLAVSGTASVADWREPEARRALSWSRYCHHIHHRFHSHPAICSILEETLRDSNRRLRDNFEGYEDLTLLDLAHCQDLLVGRLLHNPATPARILRMLFEPPLQGDLDTTEEDASGHCLHVFQYKSACKVLSAAVSSGAPSPVSARWSSGGAEVQGGGLSAWWSSGGDEVQGGGLSAQWFSGVAEVQVQGEMLMERLEALLPHGAEKSGCPAGMKAQRFLDSTLAPPPTCHVCLVVTAALLQTRRKDAAEEFLLKWLQCNEAVMQQVCSTLSSERLAALLRRHQENFGISYVDLLKNRASRMTYDLQEAQWVPESFQTDLGVTQNLQTDLGGVSFQTLTQSFRVLLSEAGPSVKSSVLEDLNHLKVSDGDFDVKGLSVWSDLLMELKA